MGTRSFIILFIVSLLGISAASIPGTEDQRKYILTDIHALDSFIVRSGKAGDLSTYYEGAYRYYDIYLDTPDYDLYKNQFSLRFRKKTLGTETTYSLQLKSEMDTGSAVRMEIEETDLQIYSVADGVHSEPLIRILNVLFLQVQTGNINPESEEAAKAIGQICQWIELKIGTPVAPFQKLSHLKLNGLDEARLRTLRPVIYGSDIRKRSHIYIDSSCTNAHLKAFPINKMEKSSTPSFFQKNPANNWILESSLDAAVFYPIIKSKTGKYLINEFEVENKYPDAAKGNEVLNLFEDYLIKTFRVSKNSDSKYCNSIKAFLQ